MSEIERFEFILPDGSKRMLSIQEARSFGSREMSARANDIVDSLNAKLKGKRKKDSFEPGWQENIKRHVTCYAEYQRILREMGLVEVGNDTSHIRDTTTTGGYYNDEFFKSAYDSGIYISGREEAAMRSGEYFKKSKAN